MPIPKPTLTHPHPLGRPLTHHLVPALPCHTPRPIQTGEGAPPHLSAVATTMRWQRKARTPYLSFPPLCPWLPRSFLTSQSFPGSRQKHGGYNCPPPGQRRPGAPPCFLAITPPVPPPCRSHRLELMASAPVTCAPHPRFHGAPCICSWRNKGAISSQPPPQPPAAPSLPPLPRHGRGHGRLGEGADFPLGSRAEGVGRELAPG